jgi:F0F1-type ATP synthase membrane subunit b/b'
LKVQVEQALHELRKEIEQIKAEAYAYSKDAENSFKKEVENMKEDRKDERVKKQAVEQSKLISQRDGKRGELEEIREQAAEAAQQISTGIISRILGR